MNKYFIEQINVSDNEYKIIELNTKNKKVNAGDLLFSYESSKATFEVFAESSSFLYLNPYVNVDSQYKIGTLIAVTSETDLSQNEIDEFFKTEDVPIATSETSLNSIITKKAQLLIDKYNVDITKLPLVAVITEDIVKELISKKKFGKEFQDISFYYTEESNNYFKKRTKKLAIIGAGKAALQLLDVVISGDIHTPVLIYDDNESLSNQSLIGIKIKNTISIDDIIKDFQEQLFDEIVISFSGDIVNREKIFQQIISNNIPIANIIHPTAIISNFTTIGVGNLIFANTRIGPFANIGDNNVISSFCSIEHHNSIGSHNTFGPAVVFSGSCTVGDQNRFGTGIYIEPNIKIGSNSIIASGLTLLTNVPSNKIVRNNNKIEFKDI